METIDQTHLLLRYGQFENTVAYFNRLPTEVVTKFLSEVYPGLSSSIYIPRFAFQITFSPITPDKDLIEFKQKLEQLLIEYHGRS